MDTNTHRIVYEPLDASCPQFRLLEISECDENIEDGPVAVTIHTVALPDSPPFAALSYVWGDPNNRVDIIVNGRPHKVTKSLSEALRYAPTHALQHMNQHGGVKCEPQAFRLWADAICINQEDVEERSHQ